MSLQLLRPVAFSTLALASNALAGNLALVTLSGNADAEPGGTSHNWDDRPNRVTDDYELRIIDGGEEIVFAQMSWDLGRRSQDTLGFDLSGSSLPYTSQFSDSFIRFDNVTTFTISTPTSFHLTGDLTNDSDGFSSFELIGPGINSDAIDPIRDSIYLDSVSNGTEFEYFGTLDPGEYTIESFALSEPLGAEFGFNIRLTLPTPSVAAVLFAAMGVGRRRIRVA